MPAKGAKATPKQLEALAKGRETMCKKYTEPLRKEVEDLKRALAVKQRQLKQFLE